MDIRIIEIVRILYQENQYVTSDALAKQLSISKRLIQKLIKENEREYKKYGFRLISKLTKGYTLEVLDDNLFHNFLSDNTQQHHRIDHIMTLLIDKNDYVKIEDLANELYVSRVTIDRLMKEIKNELANYDLTIISKPKYGIYIEGKEINKRLCYAHHSTEQKDVHEIDVIGIQRILLDIFQKYGFEMNDLAFNNLILHICIMIQRIQHGNQITEETTIDYDGYIEKEIAACIVAKLEERFHISVNQAEAGYIVMHLLGKRLIQDQQLVNPMVFACIDKILEEIKQTKNIDLTDDFDLRGALSLHVQPMLSRLKYHIKQKNPLVNKVKREMSLGYELALIAAMVIKNDLQLEMNEDETSYIALHFALAIEKRKGSERTTKIIVVCTTGLGTSRLLQYRLMNQYHLKEEHITLSNIHQLNQLDFSGYSCILTTIPLKLECGIPIILIDAAMDQRSIKKIDTFMNGQLMVEYFLKHDYLKDELIFYDQSFQNKEEIIGFMSKKIEEMYGVNLYDEIMIRENMSSTEVGNKCSMPHPLHNYRNDAIISIMVLKKAVKWQKENVRYIFLAVLPDSNKAARSISDFISSIICDPVALCKLERHLTAKQVLELLYGGEQ